MWKEKARESQRRTGKDESRDWNEISANFEHEKCHETWNEGGLQKLENAKKWILS